MTVKQPGKSVLIGISPFNTRFTREWIARTLVWANSHFDSVDVLHPGTLSQFLLEASGTPSGRAKRKARQELNRDMRKIVSAVEDSAISLNNGGPITLSDHVDDASYAERICTAREEYDANQNFRQVCLDMSSKAVSSRRTVRSDGPPPDLETAVQYVLLELPAYLDSAAVFGFDDCTLAYPGRWPVGEFIDSGRTSLRQSSNSHFINLDHQLEESNVRS